MKNYGNKRDYKKIDIYVGGVYKCSTTWANGLKTAKEKYLEKNKSTHADSVKVYWAD